MAESREIPTIEAAEKGRRVTESSGNGSGGSSAKRAGFLGFVAHEVRNPLSTALWSAELLTRMPAAERSGPRGERLSAMCLRSIARVRQLVEDHFLCERLDVEGIAVRPEPVPLREVIDAVLARNAERGTVALEVDADLAIRGDRVLLERAVDALLAVASAEKAAVRVEARVAPDGTVALSVSGSAPARDGLDDPMKGSPSDPNGRALALPLARRIAVALGGALTLSERGYVLSLPRVEGYIARPNPAAVP